MYKKILKKNSLEMTERIKKLQKMTFDETRRVSIEQACIITDVYKKNKGLPVNILRALALKESLEKIQIRIDEGEIIVGNRTAGIRGGVIFPESGMSWVEKELKNIPIREQDKFEVDPETIDIFYNELLPYWKGNTLEDKVEQTIGSDISKIKKVAKINQTDHAQGHICPDTVKWLKYGPSGLRKQIEINKTADKESFYTGLDIVLEGASLFMKRYAALAREKAGKQQEKAKEELLEIARVCDALAVRPPETFREAVQASWFLFVILQMESNASSFSPGRMDQYLYPYYKKDIEEGRITMEQALEIIEALFVKFNQIVYLRSSSSARYFAGFPIGFNIAVGGINDQGESAENELTFLFLKAQEHLGMPQPNLSARVSSVSSDDFLMGCSRVIGHGSGMPQLFNDDAVIPALINRGISEKDAKNYAIVGCVELTTMGNNLGWSDAAMFNLVKALELALNDGRCMLTGSQVGAHTGTLEDFQTYDQLEDAFERQIDYFFPEMIRCCEVVEKLHAEVLPSPFLSCVIDDCIEKGIDVTAGGAHYNLSGIQAIQCANVADSLAAVKKLVFDEGRVSRSELLNALRTNFETNELLRLRLLNKAPKYGNDIQEVDDIAQKWAKKFADKLEAYTNVRGGCYHMGLYTVSAHVPMGKNVAATPDGRKAGDPLADGGMSAVYGRDTSGPTALLRSVSRIDSRLGSNGTLLNMKFLPKVFENEEGLEKFASLIRAFIELKIIHVQFNVVNKADLLAAQANPELYKGLTIRVAGYTAYFTELAPDLQKEIIERTAYAEV